MATKRRKTKKSAKKRQMQRLIALAAMVGILILITIVTAVHLYKKWDARYESDTSVVFIEENAKVVTNDVVAFDTTKYSVAELELFIEETIDTYNTKKGNESVSQKSFVVENNVASLILNYADAKTYADFTGTELFVGSIADAIVEGYSFADVQFASIVEGKAIETSLDKFYDQTDLTVVIIKANTKVQVDGDILYVSAENVSSFGENWIVTKDGANLLGAEVDSETETESETETSTDVSDGSVDGPLVETEEESTEIIFDFGEDETPADEEDTYSEVYTYIIYK